jgi:hypothetical protein
MDIILNKLPNEYEKNKTLWVYEDNIPIFEKYNQFQKEIINEPIIKKEIINNEPVIKKDIINQFQQEIIKEPVIKKEIINNEPVIKKEIIKKDKDTTKQTPINLIINQTFTANVMKNEIRQKLIDFVTEPEFSKAFGIKKSGEIVSAIVRDSWNQSIALFISFLLDANIIYKDKSYLYNKDKNKLEILIK